METKLNFLNCWKQIMSMDPVNLIQLRNLTAVAEAGGIVLPAMPAFYQKPESFEDLGDFMAGRVCSLLDIDHALFPQWEGAQGSQ